MPQVRCTVSSCYFWDKGDYCSADTIWIRNDVEVHQEMQAGGRTGRADVEAATLGVKTATKASPADKAVETCCQTFRYRGDGPRKTEKDNRR